MEERKRNQIIIGVVLGAIGCGCLIWFTVIAAAIFYPVFVRAREKARQTQCMHNQLQIARALTQYVADYNDTFPPASRWTDGMRPYLGSEAFLQCPSARHLGCGYAFYQPLSSRKIKEISQPSYTPMQFDSTKGQRNYADNGQSLSFRHLNGVVVAFVDGHVKWLEETQAKRVFKQQNKP
jgi:prepilin-type processing-associated H-X9-DG protein